MVCYFAKGRDFIKKRYGGLLLLLFCILIGGQSAWAADIQVVLDGKPLSFEEPPYIENSRVMVPMRGVLESLGYTVQWQVQTKTVVAHNQDTTISLPVGSQTATVNGKVVSIDAPAQVKEARTFVPLRFMAEYSGATVLWEGSTKTVTIRKKTITQSIKDPVVYIQTDIGQGSGVILSEDGLIVTNFHVIENASSALFIFQDDSTYQDETTIVGMNPQRDIALLKINKSGLTPATISTQYNFGDTVFAVGCPCGRRNVVTTGIIDGFDMDIISATASFDFGNSGGGLFDSSGRLIGITSFIQGWENFSIPISVAMQVPQNLTMPLGNITKFPYLPGPPENLRCETEDDGYAYISWKPAHDADYYYVYYSESPNGPFELMDNQTLGGKIWYWGFPHCFAIETWPDKPYYIKVASVVNGRVTAESKPLKIPAN